MSDEQLKKVRVSGTQGIDSVANSGQGEAEGVKLFQGVP